MRNLEESTKIAKTTRFATLGRAAADAHRAGHFPTQAVKELAILRHQEHQITDKEVAFAGLARQLGDAASVGADLAELLNRLAALRAYELTGHA